MRNGTVFSLFRSSCISEAICPWKRVVPGKLMTFMDFPGKLPPSCCACHEVKLAEASAVQILWQAHKDITCLCGSICMCRCCIWAPALLCNLLFTQCTSRDPTGLLSPLFLSRSALWQPCSSSMTLMDVPDLNWGLCSFSWLPKGPLCLQLRHRMCCRVSGKAEHLHEPGSL